MLDKLEWLLKMIKEYPNLPVIPMINDDAIDGDIRHKLLCGNRWMCELGDAEVLMYLKGKFGIILYSDCNYVDTIAEFGKYTTEECKNLSDEELENEYNSLPWEKAIFLNVD